MSDQFVTREELDAALPHVLAAPKDKGEIETLCRRPAEGEREFVESLEMTPEDGIIGDRWKWKTWMHLDDGSPDPRVQVCILPKRILDLVWRDRENTPYPGDSIIVDMDLSEANLPAGTRLQAGSAVLEVTDVFNYGCPKWLKRYGLPSLKWLNEEQNKPLRLRGLLAQVVEAGTLNKADRLRKLG